ncbi:MAG: hypothetical protein A3H98_09140 [Bacteroidetes bacterium RIFCSPLOWO2_02_FULL_36_8]|nr:MAG: hypothetical protein A3H98_09140 [Bacteroidetes bacterium RIFCSPLOWO2_02_FULL_36_8]OFY69256.1 MAG: hypothetical protein A3G23_02185 [Bacteroidetes bacterium RIFCSPLOWO2_12_FULL_37_12]
MQTATISKTEIELLIEQKLIEILGDPDSGLKFTTSFVQKIKERLKKQSQRISHKKILEMYGKY